MTESSYRLDWVGVPEARADGSVTLLARVRGFVVELSLGDDYSAGGRMVPGHEDECLDAFDALGRFESSRRIAAYRLLIWARKRSGLAVAYPVAKVLSVSSCAGDLMFDVEVDGTLVPVVMQPDLHGHWPGEIGPVTHDRVARAAYNACLAYMLEHREAIASFGFPVALLDPHPDDPVIPDE